MSLFSIDQAVSHYPGCEEKAREVSKVLEGSLSGHIREVKFHRPYYNDVAEEPLSISHFYDSEDDFLKHTHNGNPRLTANLKHRDIIAEVRNFLSGTRRTEERYELRGSEQEGRAPAETDSALHRLGMEGYLILGETVTLGQAEQAGSALARHVIDATVYLYAKKILNSRVPNPVIIEPGSYRANGIPEVLDKLAKIAERNSALKHKLEHTTFVLSDLSRRALDTCHAVLQDSHRSGATFSYLELDSTSPDAVKQRYEQEGFLGRIVAGRAVNVLDAIGSDYIAYIDGQFYKVAARTFLNVKKLTRLTRNLEHKISIDDTVRIINERTDTPAVDRFVSYCQGLGVNRKQALEFWHCMYKSLEQQHDYIKVDIDSYGSNSDIIRNVLSTYPGNHMVSDSMRAIGLLEGVMPLLEQSAEFLCVNLTESMENSGIDYMGLRKYSPTFAQPPVWEILSAWAKLQGYKPERTPGELIGLGKNNSMLKFTRQA